MLEWTIVIVKGIWFRSTQDDNFFKLGGFA